MRQVSCVIPAKENSNFTITFCISLINEIKPDQLIISDVFYIKWVNQSVILCRARKNNRYFDRWNDHFVFTSTYGSSKPFCRRWIRRAGLVGCFRIIILLLLNECIPISQSTIFTFFFFFWFSTVHTEYFFSLWNHFAEIFGSCFSRCVAVWH